MSPHHSLLHRIFLYILSNGTKRKIFSEVLQEKNTHRKTFFFFIFASIIKLVFTGCLCHCLCGETSSCCRHNIYCIYDFNFPFQFIYFLWLGNLQCLIADYSLRYIIGDAELTADVQRYISSHIRYVRISSHIRYVLNITFGTYSISTSGTYIISLLAILYCIAPMLASIWRLKRVQNCLIHTLQRK